MHDDEPIRYIVPCATLAQLTTFIGRKGWIEIDAYNSLVRFVGVGRIVEMVPPYDKSSSGASIIHN